MSAISEQVPAGAAFLDERDPDWWKAGVPNAIDLDTLALDDTRACVLGQRCPLEVLRQYHGNLYSRDRYTAYSAALSGARDHGERIRWAVRHGFTLPDLAAEEAWRDLTSAWWVLINERRKLAADAAAAS
jgi:hypothetical protein